MHASYTDIELVAAQIMHIILSYCTDYASYTDIELISQLKSMYSHDILLH